MDWKTKLNRLRLMTKREWKKSSSLKDDFCKSGYNCEKCKDLCEKCALDVTFMPCYCVYQQTWNATDMRSPLDVDWKDFNMCNESHLKYLPIAIDTMEEQVDFWQFDEVANKSQTFKRFNLYLESLRKFQLAIAAEIIKSTNDYIVPDTIALDAPPPLPDKVYTVTPTVTPTSPLPDHVKVSDLSD